MNYLHFMSHPETDVYNFYHIYPIIQNNKLDNSRLKEEVDPSPVTTHFCLEDYTAKDCTLKITDDQNPESCFSIQVTYNQSSQKSNLSSSPQEKRKIFLHKYRTGKFFGIKSAPLLRIADDCE